jgi:hypothetical protein
MCGHGTSPAERARDERRWGSGSRESEGVATGQQVDEWQHARPTPRERLEQQGEIGGEGMRRSAPVRRATGGQPKSTPSRARPQRSRGGVSQGGSNGGRVHGLETGVPRPPPPSPPSPPPLTQLHAHVVAGAEAHGARVSHRAARARLAPPHARADGDVCSHASTGGGTGGFLCVDAALHRWSVDGRGAAAVAKDTTGLRSAPWHVSVRQARRHDPHTGAGH